MGGGPLMGCAKPLAAFQLRYDHLSPIFQLPFELDSKPQSLSPFAIAFRSHIQPVHPSPVARLSDEGVLIAQLA
jgi:hypothetical protein